MQVLPGVEKFLVREFKYLNIKILSKSTEYYLQAETILFKFWQKYFSPYQFNYWTHPVQIYAQMADAYFCVDE